MSLMLAQFYGSIWWYLMWLILAGGAIGLLIYLRKQRADED